MSGTKIALVAVLAALWINAVSETVDEIAAIVNHIHKISAAFEIYEQ
jgi:hypothetical protein